MSVASPLLQPPATLPGPPPAAADEAGAGTPDDALGTLALPELCRRVRDEAERYRCRLGSDDRYTCELLRRAIVVRDEASWQELIGCYQHQVCAWCRRADLTGDSDPEEAAAHAWEKFWKSFTARQFAAASGTAAVLNYLKLCAYTAVADLARAQQRTVPLDNVPAEVWGCGTQPDGLVLDDSSRAALWQIVMDVVKCERESVVVALLFQRGLRSAAVPLRRPDLFRSVDEVYAVTRNLLDRLRRCRALHAWLEREELGRPAGTPRRRRRA